MENFDFSISYYHEGGQSVCPLAETSDYKIIRTEENGIFTAILVPKIPVVLDSIELSFDYNFKDGDLFFGNGYQSWTVSKEYSKNDTMDYFARPLNHGYTKMVAGISSDVRFVKDDKRPGHFFSHCYTYIKHGNGDAPVDFIGSLSERAGFTVIYADMDENRIRITKDVAGTALEAGQEYEFINILSASGSYDEVFDRYFAEMNIPAPRIDHLSGYTSWYNYFKNIDEKIILRDLNALDRVQESVNVFQIDDGYETYVGDWLDLNEKKFPNGMREIAKKIHEKGYMAGIWLAPFLVQRQSRTYAEHPDWVIRDENGLPIVGTLSWGMAYILDINKPEPREYLRHVFDVVLNVWGYDLVKLDFLYAVALYPLYDRSRGTLMCEAMEFLRECCGDKLILGCGVPLGAAFGYVDACRISCDVDLSYKPKYYDKMSINPEIVSAQNAINNTIFRRHLNGRAFVSDPDVFFLRYSNLKFNMKQKILLAGINHIFGDVLFVSDNMEEYVPEDIELVKKIYKKSEYRVISADATVNDKIMIVLEDKNGKRENLWFRMSTGFSNMPEVLGVSENR